MDPPVSKLLTQTRTSDPLLLGTFYGGASALGYTAANICLRQVALDVDPVWISCIKAVPVATVASCIVASGLWRGLTMFPPPRQMVLLLLSAIFMQLAGNVAFQWSLGNIGLAVTVPLSFGCMLLGVAFLGRLWLLEPITPRSALALLVLMASITVLSFAANPGGEFPNDATFTWTVVLAGVGAACLSGIGYATGNVVIRRTLTGGVNLSATLLIMSMTGVVGLGILSAMRVGIDGMWQTGRFNLLVMLGAGVFNAIAFYSLAKALQLLPVVQVNLLSASQVAMAALAGVLFFGEAISVALVAGVLLTTLGLLLIKRREKGPEESLERTSTVPPQPRLRETATPVAWSCATDE